MAGPSAEMRAAWRAQGPICDLCGSTACGLCPKPGVPGYRCPDCMWAEIAQLRAQLTCALCKASLDGKGRFACESCIDRLASEAECAEYDQRDPSTGEGMEDRDDEAHAG